MPRVIKDIHLHFLGGGACINRQKQARCSRDTLLANRVGGRHGGTTACRDFGNST